MHYVRHTWQRDMLLRSPITKYTPPFKEIAKFGRNFKCIQKKIPLQKIWQDEQR